jgi:carbon-monoxide dehydrogenase large subunit
VEADWGDNVMFSRTIRFGDPDAALATAPRTARGTVRSSRITGVPIEPRGTLTSWDPYTRRMTTWDATQQPHVLRTFLAESLKLPETSVRVIQPAVGGAFGLKQPLYQEQVLCGWASMELGRPVKWIEQRAESFLVGGHARDTRFSYEVGFEPDGKVVAMRVEAITDVGAPAALLGWTMSFVSIYCVPGPYDVPNVEAKVTAVVTNKCPWSPYRGFGKDAAAFLMDRVMDTVARETGLAAPAVRLRNFIPVEAFPYDRASSAILDSGNYPGALDKLLAMADYAGFPARQARARVEGRRIGMGIGQELTPEGIAIPGSLMNQAYDGATVRIDPTGGVSVLVGVTNPGTGNDTALAQLCAEALGVPIAAVRVVQGDTDACPYGLGNYSSRSTMIGGGAVRAAALELRDKLLVVASSILDAPADDLSIADGRITVSGRDGRDGRDDAGLDYREAVNEVYRHTFGRHADRVEPGLEATRYFRMSNIYHQPEKDGRFSTYPTWPNGTCAAEVEVDEETGVVRILSWWLVEDAGRIVNPLLADANLHGSIAQGIGSAMFEALVYDDSAQLQTATLMDYTIPTAVELPSFQIQHQETPSPFSPLGMKGVGESGMSSTLGALAAAIENAFPDLDLRLTDLPLTPNTIWRAIREARERAAATPPEVVRS